MSEEQAPAAQRAPRALERDAWGRLHLIDAEGARRENVVPVRAFPLSDRDRHVVFVDAAGREVALVTEREELDAGGRAILEQVLAEREFLPVIERILSTTSVLEPCEWEVQTDRGRTRFVLKSEDDVRPLSDGSVLVIDAAGVRYLVPRPATLDGTSRRILEPYV